MNRRIYEVLTNPRREDRLGRLISLALLLLIAANVIANILETDAELARRWAGFFRTFEHISVAAFTAEYVLRLWTCTVDPRFQGAVLGRLRWMVTPMALIDLAAIGPFYLTLVAPGALDLRFLRSLRLLRLFRLMRVRVVSHAFGTLVRVIVAKRVELGVCLAFVVVATLLAAGAMYTVERGEPNTQFTSIPRALWWSIITITTIGYGDMVPQSPLGQVLGGIVGFIGICTLALPVGILSSGFIDEINRKRAHADGPDPDDDDDDDDGAPSCPHCGKRIDR